MTLHELFQWVHEHQGTLAIIGGALWTAIIHIVRITPTKVDDGWLAKAQAFGRRISPLVPKDLGGGFSMLGFDPAKTRTPSQPPEPPAGGGAALLLVLVLAPTVLSACNARAIRVARQTLDSVAHAAMEADSEVSAANRQLTADADSDACTLAECERRLERQRTASRAIETAVSALRSFERAVDAWEDGMQCTLREAIPGVVGAVQEMIAAFDAAGLNIPPLVRNVAQLGDALGTLAGACEDGDEANTRDFRAIANAVYSMEVKDL